MLTCVGDGSNHATQAQNLPVVREVHAAQVHTRRSVWERDSRSGRASRVAIMQPADHGKRNDLASIGGLALTRLGCVLVEC